MSTNNIANGLTAGLVVYSLIKLTAGHCRELGWGAILLGVLYLIYYVFDLPHR
jgi:AGZA family xanthine/uracil permease-like MFS transporter